ncbi:exonuclease domain-containing protein [Micrococcus sp.]|uniref:exonuclease domain-containing protein n=1 Tax=Micrococcus sp. TaxID=1271 RepID=UPI002A90F7C7|nr:exonuclease domain-containing protein [Micrococcus sp.]MDY6055699.1 exonuclease domain-containing protein [Micrococcus sp.]
MSAAAPVPGLAFTAIDFETANGFRGSPCAVGLVRVREGVMVEWASWLMRPPAGFDRFDPRNVRIHGILAEQVARAPRFGELWEQIAAFIGEDVLVAHNAAFDLGVIESALEVSGADVPSLDYACTLALCRRIYDLASYALPSAAAEAGFTPGRHHDALADAEACAAVLVDLTRRAVGPDGGGVDALLHSQGMRRSRLHGHPAGPEQESRATRQARGMADLFDARVPLRDERVMPDFMRWPDEGVNPPPNPDAAPGHPLYRQTVVFTGGIAMSRQAAKQRAAHHGAQTANRVNAATTMLVVGDGFEAADLQRPTGEGAGRPEAVTGALGHRKTRDALRRRAQGQAIALVTEAEFLQMIGGAWPQPPR